MIVGKQVRTAFENLAYGFAGWFRQRRALTVLELTDQPYSLLILGGGYIGCELGHFFASLGTKVRVVDQSECLRVSYRTNPHPVFGNPQIGAVGLSERECRERGLRYAVARKDCSDFAKGVIHGSPPGFAKLIVEKETDRILGFHLVGLEAADLIHEVMVAMNAGEGDRESHPRYDPYSPHALRAHSQVFDELG